MSRGRCGWLLALGWMACACSGAPYQPDGRVWTMPELPAALATPSPSACSGTPAHVDVIVPGGVSLGSYQGGVLAVLVETLRRRPERLGLTACREEVSLGVHGASAGALNTLAAALHFCAAWPDEATPDAPLVAQSPAPRALGAISPAAGLYRLLWDEATLFSLSHRSRHHDEASETLGVGLLSAEVVRDIADAALHLAAAHPDWRDGGRELSGERLAGYRFALRPGCRVESTIALTSVVEPGNRDPNRPTMHAVALVLVVDEAGRLRVYNSRQARSDAGGTDLAWVDLAPGPGGRNRCADLEDDAAPCEEVGFHAYTNLLLASSALPGAFGMRRVMTRPRPRVVDRKGVPYIGPGNPSADPRPVVYTDGGVFANTPVYAGRLSYHTTAHGEVPGRDYRVRTLVVSDGRLALALEGHVETVPTGSPLMHAAEVWVEAARRRTERQFLRGHEEVPLRYFKTRAPLASDFLAATLGFAHRDFRRHDIAAGMWDAIEELAEMMGEGGAEQPGEWLESTAGRRAFSDQVWDVVSWLPAEDARLLLVTTPARWGARALHPPGPPAHTSEQRDRRLLEVAGALWLTWLRPLCARTDLRDERLDRAQRRAFEEDWLQVMVRRNAGRTAVDCGQAAADGWNHLSLIGPGVYWDLAGEEQRGGLRRMLGRDAVVDTVSDMDAFFVALEAFPERRAVRLRRETSARYMAALGSGQQSWVQRWLVVPVTVDTLLHTQSPPAFTASLSTQSVQLGYSWSTMLRGWSAQNQLVQGITLGAWATYSRLLRGERDESSLSCARMGGCLFDAGYQLEFRQQIVGPLAWSAGLRGGAGVSNRRVPTDEATSRWAPVWTVAPHVGLWFGHYVGLDAFLLAELPLTPAFGRGSEAPVALSTIRLTLLLGQPRLQPHGDSLLLSDQR